MRDLQHERGCDHWLHRPSGFPTVLRNHSENQGGKGKENSTGRQRKESWFRQGHELHKTF